jgi:hypothetical protein
MGLVNNLAEIVCLARKDIVGSFRISGQPYAVEWRARPEPTPREMKALLNFAWCAGMCRYEEDHHLPEVIEVRWNRDGESRATVSYPVPAEYFLELQQV